MEYDTLCQLSSHFRFNCLKRPITKQTGKEMESWVLPACPISQSLSNNRVEYFTNIS